METDVAELHRVFLLHALHDARGQRLAGARDRVTRRHPALHGRLPVAASRPVLVQLGVRAALHRGVGVSAAGTVLVPGLVDRPRHGRVPGQPLEREDARLPLGHLRRPGPVARRLAPALSALTAVLRAHERPLGGGYTSVRHLPPARPDRVGAQGHPWGHRRPGHSGRPRTAPHSTVTDFARFLGWSTSFPRAVASSQANTCNGTAATSGWMSGGTAGRRIRWSA